MSTVMCELYPAIDVRAGKVVRLHQGDYARETRYAATPLQQAAAYAEQGARWLHLVDLDAARAGGYTLRPLLAQLKSTTTLRVQTGGGVRDEADVEALLRAGADRVVVGSLAVREPQRVAGWLRQFGAERITVALDTRRDGAGRWMLPVQGWTQDSRIGLIALLDTYVAAGLRHLLCTDIDRDGTLAGPNLALYAQLQMLAPELQMQASGGVSSLDDVRAARGAGLSGLVLGKALLEQRFSLTEALSC